MQIKEVIKIAALMLNRKEIIDYVDGDTENVGVEVVNLVDIMTGLTNLVINELACSYIPMMKSDTLKTEKGKIYYDKLSEKVIKICSVFSDSGKLIEFTQTPEYLAVDSSIVTVNYEYSPHNYSFDEEIGYTERDISSRVLAYGLMAELALCEGRFEEGVAQQKRFVDCVCELCVPKSVTIKKRSWY